MNQAFNGEKRIFNYRLSRAHRCVECAFGILGSKCRFLGTELETNVKTSENIVKAACLLHNIILEEEGLCLDDFNEQIEPMPNNRGNENQWHVNRGTNSSIQIRKAFASYFMSPEGEVLWHGNIIS